MIKPARLTAVTMFVLGVSVLVACGESEEDKIRSVVGLIPTHDPAICDRLTKEFLKQSYKSVDDCERDDRTQREEKMEIRRVAIHDDRAVVQATFNGQATTLRLVKESDEWKVASFELQDPASHLKDSNPADKPRIQKGLDPRETVSTYYRAIEEEDAAVLCGVLSRRHARTVLGSGQGKDPIAACAGADFNWVAAQRKAAGVKPVDVIRSANRATVELSHGKQAVLVRDNGRWVIDEIK